MVMVAVYRGITIYCIILIYGIIFQLDNMFYSISADKSILSHIS